jgi:hypothetical protein
MRVGSIHSQKPKTTEAGGDINLPLQFNKKAI